MKKRMTKYNLIVVMLIVLIPLVYCLSAYFDSVSQMTILDQLPENPSETLPVEKPTISEDVVESNTSPVFSNGMDAVVYALNVIESGISFECDLYHRTTCAGIGSVDVLFKQTRYKNHDLMRIWSKCSVPVQVGNFYKSMYNNCEQDQTRWNYDTSRFSYENKTNTFIDSDVIEGDFIPEFIETDEVGGWCNFFTEVNSTLGRVIYFDKSNKDYYVVKISMYQSKLNDSNYASSLITYGDMVGCDLRKLNMTFTIDKKTGYLLSCAREETFVVNLGTMDLLTCNATGVHTYRYKDTKDTIIQYVQQNHNVGF